METTSIPSAHALALRETLNGVQELKNADSELSLDGDSLNVAAVVAVARHGLLPSIKGYSKSEENSYGNQHLNLKKRLSQSIRVLDHHIENGWVVYGVNTGFGGSADSRTEQLKKLQVSLLQHTQSAVIASSDREESQIDQDGQSHTIPKAWVKAAMVIRANQNLRGHSAVRLEVIDTLLDLLRHDITPLVPLRGTISASGDLMPLSYIAGTLIGDPNISVTVGSSGKQKARVCSAQDALNEYGIKPIELQPKEGLGLINGTAPSAALASLVIHEANQLAILAQALTAFTSECLAGNVEWANAFIHKIRPHAGQIEAAQNIRQFLKSSDFVIGLESRKRTGKGLWQDRYSTRTAPQWMGPYLEDLMLAQRQIEVELNSTSDNPVIDAGPGDDLSGGDVYSGGNFQATAITSAMDKTRTALQMIGRMIFSQCTELINPATNNGLDPNLVFGDPDQSYTMKGIDVNMSAYMSELAALAHPVSAHVQSAEMHNQGINSLAFLTGRRTMEAVDVLSHMCAAHLYVCCQAIDLRAYHERFLSSVSLPRQLDRTPMGINDVQRTQLITGLDDLVRSWWYEANKVDHLQRCSLVASRATSHIFNFVSTQEEQDATLSSILNAQREFQQSMEAWLLDPANNPNLSVSNNKTVANMDGLGQGSSILYDVVRRKLDVGFHHGLKKEQKATIGTNVSLIYEEIRRGSVVPSLMPCLGNDNYKNSPMKGLDTPTSSNDPHEVTRMANGATRNFQ
ncbi:phenylalanine ammonia-lyase [Colletotrichum karsti]|uniref:Phenylalanine ammonia-lyase n=1 Tax=Colletotrichum karsti TaxID=1095194 RepID=A0A9P6I6P2_9PEZI|nr:phenylalanine ammonia-lyase [Colletotrichum karsti]KAF9876056.1 phenylalanine ammonia-lyase [Colletotrichum karsti]